MEHIKECSCKTPVEGLPIDVAYFSTGLSQYVIQRTCNRCKRTLTQPIEGTTREILIEVLSANNLMAKGSDESRRRMLGSEAVLRLFHTQETELLSAKDSLIKSKF